MTTFAAVKSMTRNLTPEEEKIVKRYLKDIDIMKKPMSVFRDISLHFEEQFKTPVTEFCIKRCVTEMLMGGEFEEFPDGIKMEIVSQG